MEGIYNVSSSEKVRNLEKDLQKELRDLKIDIESGDFLSKTGSKSFR